MTRKTKAVDAHADPIPIGPASRSMLAKAGIHTFSELKQAGSVAAYVRVKACCPQASLNLLWGLEGLVSGIHWRDVAKHHRTRMLLALDAALHHTAG